MLRPTFTEEDAECIRLANVHLVPEPGKVRIRKQATKTGRARGEGWSGVALTPGRGTGPLGNDW